MVPIILTQRNLPRLAKRLAVPEYDRSTLKPGIVHIGVGGFHRAHQAFYIDRLLRQGRAQDYAIIGLGLLPGDQRLGEALKAQDCLYTLVAKDEDGGRKARVIGSMIDWRYGPDDPSAAVALLAAPETKLVTLTITEGGYNFDQVSGEFQLSNPAIRAELSDPAHPRSVFGYLTAALAARRAAGTVPFTVVSCDNITGNGEVARNSLLAF
ncbi:MAG: mannitol dehydrogenase family protein, partial [Propionibacteriaceae bacterium]|nr:mannitol dehydrogenase family protein [Propionibacteriaceae bacterium]